MAPHPFLKPAARAFCVALLPASIRAVPRAATFFGLTISAGRAMFTDVSCDCHHYFFITTGRFSFLDMETCHIVSIAVLVSIIADCNFLC